MLNGLGASKEAELSPYEGVRATGRALLDMLDHLEESSYESNGEVDDDEL